MTSLDSSEWRIFCAEASRCATQRCGQSYGYFVDLFSEAVDGAVAKLPLDQHAEALQVAVDYGYETREGRVDAQQWNAENGYCTHGIELGCCPAGCGSGPEE